MLVLMTIVGGNCFGSVDGNAEYWQVVGFDYNLDDDWKVAVREELKFGRSGDDPYQHNTDVGLVYKGLADWVDVSLNFRKEYQRNRSGNFVRENRPHLNFMFKSELFGFEVGDRVRLEYRDLKNFEDRWRFRNRFTINLPFTLTEYKLQPFVSDEIFIRLGESIVNQNRFMAGLSFKITENIKSSVFWMYKSNMTPSSGWIDTNVLGTSLVFNF